MSTPENLRVLVCNDDGIAAPGLHLLAEAALVLGSDVWIVAPDRKWTAASHQLSFDRDLTLTRTAERTLVCSGTPADCIIAAMSLLFADGPKPDLVLAGINDKRNVGEDAVYSGTMAIAREATFWGVPAIAVSQGSGTRANTDQLATLRQLLVVLWTSRTAWAAEGHWLAVNLPALLPARMVQAQIGRDKIGSACDVRDEAPDRITYRIRRGRPGTSSEGDENAAIGAGHIGVVRHRWHADAPLPECLVADWNRRIDR
jgi:5'-nucleotidase